MPKRTGENTENAHCPCRPPVSRFAEKYQVFPGLFSFARQQPIACRSQMPLGKELRAFLLQIIAEFRDGHFLQSGMFFRPLDLRLDSR